MKKFTLLALMILSSVAFGQKIKYSKEQLKEMDNDYFEQGYTAFSTKKPARIKLKSGRAVEGKVTDVDHKKLLFNAIEIKDEATGKKEKFAAADIEELYLPVNGFEKGMRTANYFTKVNNWQNKSVKTTTNKDESYYKSVKTLIKGKKNENTYLLQLLNPEFSQIIEVFSDPTATETGGVSFGMGPQIGGGVTKSYYVVKNGESFWLRKKDFEENYSKLFGDNAEFMKQYPYESVEWPFFSWLVMKYTEMSLNK